MESFTLEIVGLCFYSARCGTCFDYFIKKISLRWIAAVLIEEILHSTFHALLAAIVAKKTKTMR